jgi:hypothetical protein
VRREKKRNKNTEEESQRKKHKKDFGKEGGQLRPTLCLASGTVFAL